MTPHEGLVTEVRKLIAIRKLLDSIAVIAFSGIVIAGFSAIVWLFYWIWSINHPMAPWWGFILSGGK